MGITPNLLFTKGIFSDLDERENFLLKSGNKTLKLCHKKDVNPNFLKDMEDRFAIKLVGVQYNSEKGPVWHNAKLQDKGIIDLEQKLDEIFMSAGHAVLFNIKKIILGTGDFDEFDIQKQFIINLYDIGIRGGDKEILELTYRTCCEIYGHEFVNAFISMVDFRFLLDDIRNIAFRSLYNFRELNLSIKEILVDYWEDPENNHAIHPDEYDIENDIWEYYREGTAVDRLGFYFTECVISLRSILDLLARLYFAVDSLKKHDNTKILKIPGKTFKDIKRKHTHFNSPNMKNTIFDKKFLALTQLRNDLIHGLTCDRPGTRLYIGCGLPPVKSQKIVYGDYITRDFDEKGQPTRWNNRSTFTRQENRVQNVLGDWIGDMLITIENTLLYLRDYTDFIFSNYPKTPLLSKGRRDLEQ